MPRWFDTNPEGAVTQDDFLRFEAVAGYALPLELREHLEMANGGYAEPSGYVVPHPDGRIDVRQVDCFLALHGNHWDGEVPDAYRRRPLLDVLADLQDEFPDDAMVPFALDAFGGVLAVRIDAGDPEQVVLITPDGEDPYNVAPSFAAFLENLH
jgi:cell wall assembly regulator SMI1